MTTEDDAMPELPEGVHPLDIIRTSPAFHDFCEAMRLRGERNERVRQEWAAKEAAKAERKAAAEMRKRQREAKAALSTSPPSRKTGR